MINLHMNMNDYSTRLEISRSACIGNFRHFRGQLRPETKMLVLVKANAYGHGAVQFAGLMEDAGADCLAVACAAEGAELRKGGIRLPIIVLPDGRDGFEDMIEYGLEPGIPDLEMLKAFCAVLKEKGIEGYPVHIKLDTGMHRLGFCPDEVDGLGDFLTSCGQIKVKSVYSHLCAAEDPGQDAFTESQARLFIENYEKISGRTGYRPLRHLLNSAGIERFPQYQFDMVRLGIGVYGISAVPGTQLRPAASFKCRILQIKTLHAGETIGYGRMGKAPHDGVRTATISAGYADGIDRRLGNGNASFMLNGHKVPTIGNICMDTCMIDVTGTDAASGDTVTVFGEDPHVSELADRLGTIPYEIMVSVPSRVKRIVTE